ncbi:MAG: helix-turn-helix domain-containing protein [Chitinophagaceae bacterium]|nr:helix-turn-helix domain-containing protein [Chitinophagaceae bacterium]MCW5927500.1 helix-turn-helix domain-containing protein [Chitinophagaceae bacterium]
MKPILRKFSPAQNQSFFVQTVRGKDMINPWHYHPEIEIVYIKNSAGTLAAGDYMSSFQPGDVMLFGAHLPHTTVHEPRYISSNLKTRGEAITVHFLLQNIGRDLLETPEMTAVNNLLTNIAPRGILLKGKTRDFVITAMSSIISLPPAKRMLCLLGILEYIADTGEYEILAGKGYTNNASDYDNNRLKAVYDYTFQNYHRPVYLEELAALTHLTRQSFCRFFKNTNRKTYFQFLMEVRIGQACRLLADDTLTIQDISNSCGYNNMAHFIRQFRKVTGKNPLQFKKKMLATQRDAMAM